MELDFKRHCFETPYIFMCPNDNIFTKDVYQGGGIDPVSWNGTKKLSTKPLRKHNLTWTKEEQN